MAKSKSTEPLNLEAIEHREAQLCIVGESGLFFNSMSAKAQRELLFPSGRKTASDRKVTLKHAPHDEFRWSVYTTQPEAATLLGFPAAGIKAALATAALATTGITKADIQRMVYIPGDVLEVFGRPYLRSAVVRSADMNRTPDVRTRAFLPEWAMVVNVAFAYPVLSVPSVAQLLSNAGRVCGIGDFRQEKGRGDFGRWRVVGRSDPDFQRIVTEQGRDVQTEAMRNPVAYDATTRDLLQFFEERAEERGFDRVDYDNADLVDLLAGAGTKIAAE